jgi:hypothetical protein
MFGGSNKSYIPKPTTKKRILEIPETKKKKAGIFALEVRRKGQFKTEGIFETEQQALTAGVIKTRYSAAASFRVKGSTIGKSVVPNKQYYSSKKEAGVFIQKRTYRISTPGEKREITFKGIAINKMRRGVF